VQLAGQSFGLGFKLRFKLLLKVMSEVNEHLLQSGTNQFLLLFALLLQCLGNCILLLYGRNPTGIFISNHGLQLAFEPVTVLFVLLIEIHKEVDILPHVVLILDVFVETLSSRHEILILLVADEANPKFVLFVRFAVLAQL
jgi:hypothetical protein